MKASEVIVDRRGYKNINAILQSNSEIKEAFERAKEKLKYNCFAGHNIKKEMFPKEIVRTFNPTNLYVYDLIRRHPGWRMIYTVTNEGKVKILVVVLDIMDHHKYNRMFGYK